MRYHFSRETKTFAGISIWSCEAVFPSCPIIHHLFERASSWVLPPHAPLSSATHTHAHLTPLPSVFLPHSWPYIHKGTFCNLMQLRKANMYTHTHAGCNEQTSVAHRCVATKCKAALEHSIPCGRPREGGAERLARWQSPLVFSH